MCSAYIYIYIYIYIYGLIVLYINVFVCVFCAERESGQSGIVLRKVGFTTLLAK